MTQQQFEYIFYPSKEEEAIQLISHDGGASWFFCALVSPGWIQLRRPALISDLMKASKGMSTGTTNRVTFKGKMEGDPFNVADGRTVPGLTVQVLEEYNEVPAKIRPPAPVLQATAPR